MRTDKRGVLTIEEAAERLTIAGYRVAVNRHLIPGLGAHRLDRLEPEHLEKLCAAIQRRSSGRSDGDELRRQLGLATLNGKTPGSSVRTTGR
ncbi:hypothetical protein [Dactylosporangium sp. NPDC050588]|uniref:hypothetical protein n=1 Tax=Dactylosporangium sp. NPDC050588 TaxID=3157211 RepID=UPI0033D12CAD